MIISFIECSIAQPGSPPPPPSGHGQNGNQGGGNAPLGSGLLITVLLGGAYGLRKIRQVPENNK